MRMPAFVFAAAALTYAPAAFAQALQVEGHYSAPAAAASAVPRVDLDVIVLDNPTGTVAARTATAQGSCTGTVAGIGQLVGRTLTFTPYERAGTRDRCRIRVEFDAQWRHATLRASDCGEHHGAACGWEGQAVTKVDHPAPPR